MRSAPACRQAGIAESLFRFLIPNSAFKKMFPYYFIRFSGPLLLILVGLKIVSGYALVGRIAGVSWLSGLHQNRAFDILLLFLFIFHAFYGLRLFLIDLGMMKKEKSLLWIFTIISAGLFVLSYIYFF
jgi:succinate dehydrogenase/fumarate reductase cytochrome b subunit